ncbi:9584_t:CDS:2 [Acaulospora colombiana]|uniref:9584_t:CDS:1 n=1 Tax=Acaulospora colombiana TaxID=27376 RepID=A0ACA9P725_9GLOM|nr:9584_t:CDS:2 [Acaulospora colombiana]
MMRDLLMATGPGARKSFQLPALNKPMREKVHLMARVLNLKSTSDGKKNQQLKIITVSRTSKTGAYTVNERKMDSILKRKGDKRRGGDVMKGIQEGEVIGHKAAKLDETNIGYRLLAQMGFPSISDQPSPSHNLNPTSYASPQHSVAAGQRQRLIDAAPLKVVEPHDVPNDEVAAFLRSVRIGLLGAHANVETGTIEDDPLKVLEEELRILIGESGPSSNEASSETDPATAVKDSDSIAMRPEDEWTALPSPRLDDMDELMKKIIITQLEQQDMCEQYTNSFRAKWDRFHDWVRDVFGLAAIERPPCGFQAILGNSSSPRVGSTTAFAEPALPHPVKTPAYRPASMEGSNGSSPMAAGGWLLATTKTGLLHQALATCYLFFITLGRTSLGLCACIDRVVQYRMVYVFIVIGFRWWQNRASEEYEELKDEEEANEELEGVILFDAGSIKNLSLEHLPLYQEKP